MAGEAGTSSLAAPGGPLPPIATSQSSPALHTHGRRRRAPRTEPLIVPGTWAGTTPVPFGESEREIEGRSLRGRGKEERKRTAERGARGTLDGHRADRPPGRRPGRRATCGAALAGRAGRGAPGGARGGLGARARGAPPCRHRDQRLRQTRARRPGRPARARALTSGTRRSPPPAGPRSRSRRLS